MTERKDPSLMRFLRSVTIYSVTKKIRHLLIYNFNTTTLDAIVSRFRTRWIMSNITHMTILFVRMVYRTVWLKLTWEYRTAINCYAEAGCWCCRFRPCTIKVTCIVSALGSFYSIAVWLRWAALTDAWNARVAFPLRTLALKQLVPRI